MKTEKVTKDVWIIERNRIATIYMSQSDAIYALNMMQEKAELLPATLTYELPREEKKVTMTETEFFTLYMRAGVGDPDSVGFKKLFNAMFDKEWK